MEEKDKTKHDDVWEEEEKSKGAPIGTPASTFYQRVDHILKNHIHFEEPNPYHCVVKEFYCLGKSVIIREGVETKIGTGQKVWDCVCLSLFESRKIVCSVSKISGKAEFGRKMCTERQNRHRLRLWHRLS